VDGIDLAGGATAHHEGEASINNLMASRAAKVVVVADSSKVGRRAFARICPVAEIDVLVTDPGIGEQAAAGFREQGVDVLLA
jgi:DeoR/GlpR family transcriptional regulator of sugar metabolism